VSNLNATRDGLRVVRTILAERTQSRHHQDQSATPASASPVHAVEESVAVAGEPR
jgi:hypothetical protein